MSVIVTIVTGPVRSGKTSRLMTWAQGREDVAGLLSPDGPGGRIFLDLATADTMAMEGPGADEAVVMVGRFRFRAAAFDWANARLRKAAEDARETTLVVDEVGPLELAGGGLRPGVLVALARTQGRVILVVRAPLVEAVRRGFGIDQAEITSAIG